MTHHAVIYRDHAGQYRYRIIAGNGETVAQSEAYTRRWSARRAVRKNHPEVQDVTVA